MLRSNVYRCLRQLHQDHLLGAVARADVPEMVIDYATFTQLFQHHAGKTLFRYVMRLPTSCSTFIAFLKRFVDELVSVKCPLTPESTEDLCEQYTRHICHAATALSPDTLQSLIQKMTVGSAQPVGIVRSIAAAGAAAIGNVQMFLDYISNIHDILRTAPHFPNALDAAVAANQKEMTNVILRYILATVKEPWKTGTWYEMRQAAVGLFNTLRIAIRLHHHDIANMLRSTLAQNNLLGHSIPPTSRRLLHEDCVQYSNVESYGLALYYKRYKAWPWDGCNKANGNLVEPTKDEVGYLLKRCSKWILRRLIETKHLDPKYVG